jgi:hypothetical protein
MPERSADPAAEPFGQAVPGSTGTRIELPTIEIATIVHFCTVERNDHPGSGILQPGETGSGIIVSISKSYFRRQAPLLRRMLRLAQDPIVADRLSEMARDYEMKAGGDPEEPPAALNAKDDNDHGQTN